MRYPYFKIDRLMYGWINFRIAEYCLEASDFLNYDLPKKLIEKIIRLIKDISDEEWLYVQNEPGAEIMCLDKTDNGICFSNYSCKKESYELDPKDEKGEQFSRDQKLFSIEIDFSDIIDSLVSEFSLYENGNGRKLYEYHWGEFPCKEFIEIKNIAFDMDLKKQKGDELFCSTFLK